TACQLFQRPRQLRTVSTLTPRSLASSAFLFPSAAKRIMRPRLASCWCVVCRCTSVSSLVCSSSLNLSSAGFGPFCISSALLFFPPILPHTYFSLHVLVGTEQAKTLRMKILRGAITCCDEALSVYTREEEPS